jgi:hypothetical protein
MSAGSRRPPIGTNDNRRLDENADRDLAPDHCHGDPAALPDIGALDFAAQFLVWAVRNWVGAFKSNLGFAMVTEGAFERFGLARSAAAIDATMTIVAASASRSIDVRCVKCRYLSPDEAIFVDAVAAIQTDEHLSAYSGLNKLMPMSAVRAAFPHLENLARDLAASRLRPRPILRAGFDTTARNKGEAALIAAPVSRYLH